MIKPKNKKQENLFEAVDQFALAMKKKLAKKERAGWKGWDWSHRKRLKIDFLDHLLEPDEWDFLRMRKGAFSRENLIDLANFCMFLWVGAKK